MIRIRIKHYRTSSRSIAVLLGLRRGILYVHFLGHFWAIWRDSYE